MVTTNSKDFRAIYYRFSTEPDERALYKQAEAAYEKVMRLLRPILKYITIETGFDEFAITVRFATVISIAQGVVIIDREGHLRLRDRDSSLCEWRTVDYWDTLPFCDLLAGLSDILAKAEEQKRLEAQALKMRREEIVNILKPFMK